VWEHLEHGGTLVLVADLAGHDTNDRMLGATKSSVT
jgi:hypothetical protein